MYLCMHSGLLYDLKSKLYDVKILSDLHFYIASTGECLITLYAKQLYNCLKMFDGAIL